MANLKGGSFEKQIKDIHHRLSAFGESRHGRNDNQTHSSALSIKRAEISRSFANYCEHNQLDGKLNELMTNENIKSFLDERCENFAKSTAENYTRAFSSMIQGLEHSNVDIPYTKDVFEEKMAEIRDMPDLIPEQGRAIEEVEKLIEDLYKDRYSSGVLAEIQNEIGVRVSEAYKIAQNVEKYYNESSGTINGLIGKGNHIYAPKEISSQLIEKIRQIEEMPTQRTYSRDLEKYEVTTHDFRYTYAAREFEEKIANGVEYNKALREVSEELNHSRGEMTNYYRKRA